MKHCVLGDCTWASPAMGIKKADICISSQLYVSPFSRSSFTKILISWKNSGFKNYGDYWPLMCPIKLDTGRGALDCWYDGWPFWKLCFIEFFPTLLPHGHCCQLYGAQPKILQFYKKAQFHRTSVYNERRMWTIHIADKSGFASCQLLMLLILFCILICVQQGGITDKDTTKYPLRNIMWNGGGGIQNQSGGSSPVQGDYPLVFSWARNNKLWSLWLVSMRLFRQLGAGMHCGKFWCT